MLIEAINATRQRIRKSDIFLEKEARSLSFYHDPAQIKRDVVREIRELRKHLRELQHQFEK